MLIDACFFCSVRLSLCAVRNALIKRTNVFFFFYLSLVSVSSIDSSYQPPRSNNTIFRVVRVFVFISLACPLESNEMENKWKQGSNNIEHIEFHKWTIHMHHHLRQLIISFSRNLAAPFMYHHIFI